MTPISQKAADFLATSEQLIAVLDREVASLRQFDADEMKLLQQEKLSLANAYSAGLEALVSAPNWQDSLPLDTQQKLKSSSTRFQASLQANERALRAAHAASDQVLKHIVSEVERRRAAPSGYGAHGAMHQVGRQGVSVSVNQQL